MEKSHENHKLRWYYRMWCTGPPVVHHGTSVQGVQGCDGGPRWKGKQGADRGGLNLFCLHFEYYHENKGKH